MRREKDAMRAKVGFWNQDDEALCTNVLLHSFAEP